MNIYKTATNYRELLNKVGWTTTIVVLVLTIVLRSNVEWLNRLLTSLEASYSFTIGSNQFPALTLGIAIVVGIIARTIKLHDIISDVFKIRLNFDVKYILKIYCNKLNIFIDSTNMEELYENRSKLMYSTFYCYASSTEGENKIDRHAIIMAIDQWANFWIFEEAIFFIIIANIILIFSKVWLPAGIMVLLIIIALFIMKVSYNKSIIYASNQITLILDDPVRKKEVEAKINEVLHR